MAGMAITTTTAAGMAITTTATSTSTIHFPSPSIPKSSRPTLLPLHRRPHIPNSTAPCFSPPLSLTTNTTNTEILDDPVIPNSPNHQNPPKIRPLPPHDIGHEFFGEALQLAARNWDLRLGRAAHAAIIKTQEEGIVINKLISMYLKLGCILNARKVFDEMAHPDVVSYTSLISAYAKSGREKDAMRLFSEMRDLGINLNGFTFVAMFTSCMRHLNSQLGLQLHGLSIKTCCLHDLYVSNALLSFYVKLGRVDDALRLFGEVSEKDVSSWNAIILGMVKEFRYSEAFMLFHDMRMNGVYGDGFTISSLLTMLVESKTSSRVEGAGIHAHSIKIGIESDLSLCNGLIAFYTKFGCMEDVVGIFFRMPTKDIISYTAMISGYMKFGQVESAVKVFNEMSEVNCITYNALMAGFCRNGRGFHALELFRKIVESGMELSDFTLSSAVHACALVSEMENCAQLHGFVLKVGGGFNSPVEAALLDMYARCNQMEDAQKILNKWIGKEGLLIATTSLISGYSRNGQFIEALHTFLELVTKGDATFVDEVLITTVLGICGALGFTDLGKQIHCSTLKCSYPSDILVGNSLLSMYSKCGFIDDATKVFSSMQEHDIVSWNSLISAHLLHWQGDEALVVWEKLELINIKPDSVSFVLIIASCKYTRFSSVDVCRKLFSSMQSCRNIKPSEEHYAALVTVLCHWNCFHEAEEVIKSMACKPGPLVWRALLNCCRNHSDLSLMKYAAQNILDLKPVDPSTYVLISNLYAATGRWHCSEKLREEMKKKGMHKHPSQSWIIHRNKIDSFHTRDKSHPSSKDIYSALDILILECMKVGYIPDTTFVLHEVEEFQKKDFLFYHSAKLAATYGHLITAFGKPVRVMKNIHLCGDCHSFLKFVSIVTSRKITFRDSTGFHCFQAGECSCRDHW